MKGRLPAAAGVAVLGALLELLAAGRTWGHGSVTGHGPVAASGSAAAPGLTALALATLALAVAVLAAASILRRVGALLGVVVAGASIAVVVHGHDHVTAVVRGRAFGVRPSDVAVHGNAWWVLALAGALLAAAGYAAVVVFARRWQGLGPRYDAPASKRRAADPAVAAWDALDRGDDPTAARAPE